MSIASRLRGWLVPLRRTPLHPQWLVLREERRKAQLVRDHAHGIVLDVGCMDRWAARHVRDGACYVGVDFPGTVGAIYHTRPDVFGDAAALPVGSASVDTALLLDVLEHLPEPERALSELARVLRPGGRLLLTVPFLYPVHDAPYDFRRWTRHGLEHALEASVWDVAELRATGAPATTAALMCNLALARAVLDWIERRNPLALLVVLAVPLFALSNVLGLLLAWLAPASGFMATGHVVVAKRVGTA